MNRPTPKHSSPLATIGQDASRSADRCHRYSTEGALSRLHVAVLDEELPYPLTSRKRIRSFNLLTRLAKLHRVTYITHRNVDPDEVRPAVEALREHGISPVLVDYQ